MKKLQILAAGLFILGLAGCSSVKPDDPAATQGFAIIRTIKGTATYTTSNGTTGSVKPNITLHPGATIATGPDSFVYVSVNGLSSAVRIGAETTLILETMQHRGSLHDGKIDTVLNLKAGSIVGQVKKISADSRYEIKTPHGLATVRGTDFEVDVVSNGIGQYKVTFASLTGTVVASAVVTGNLQTKTLQGGESWTVGGEVVPIKWELMNIDPIFWQPGSGLAPGFAPITILPVFPYGAAPLGPSAPPRK